MAKFSFGLWMVFLVGLVAAVGLILLLGTEKESFVTDTVGQALTLTRANLTTGGNTINGSMAVSVHCTDSDGGEDMYTQGTTRGEALNTNSGVKRYSDSCETSAFDLEYFCDSDDCVKEYYCETDTAILQGSQEKTGAVRWNWYDCEHAEGYTCSDGACVYDPSDLTIYFVQVAVYRSTETGVVNVIVENEGSVDAAVGTYEITLEQVMEDGSTQSETQFGDDTTLISPGGSRTISLEFSLSSTWMDDFETFSDDEIINLQVLLDIDDEVVEADETNNEYSAEMNENDGEIIEAAE